MKKNTKLLIIVGVLLLVVVGASLAYYIAKVKINGAGSNITGDTERMIEVVYDAGGKLDTDEMYPGVTTSKEFTVTMTPGSVTNEATYVIKLNLTENTFEYCTDENYDEITNACKKNKPELIYTLKDSSGNILATSNITGKTGEIELARETKTVSEKTTYKYTLEITYVETNADQNHNANKKIEGAIKVDFAYKYNTLKKTSMANGTKAAFLGSDITKEEIESITILDKIDVPEGAKSFDVSENQNKSVMMWYTDIDNNNLYEVYIGGEGGVNANPISDGLFSYLTNLASIDLNHFNTSNVTSMANMFNSTGLTSLDLSHFDTSNVTDMRGMFIKNQKLKSLNISSFDTSKVTNMWAMFNSTGLTSLDLRNFNTSNVTDMSGMFAASRSLDDLDISNFDTSKVTNMATMFSTTGLKSLDLSHFNTSNVTDMSGMFSLTRSLNSLNISSFDTSKVANMSSMFGQTNITNLDLSNFDTSNVTNMNSMFLVSYYENLDLSHFDTKKVTDMSRMFEGGHFNTIKFNNAIFNSVTEHNNMFDEECSVSNIYVKDATAKTFIDARLNEAGISSTVTIAS